MRLYIAGGMSGHKFYNFPAFDAKRDELRAQGHLPISPADLDRAIGLDPFKEDSAQIEIDRQFMAFTIQRDVDAILQCDGIVMLSGWENSRGAKAEKVIAEWIGIPVFYPGDTIPLTS